MSKKRLTTSKCRRCSGHGIKTAVKGHASRCPYRYCDCHHCQKVVSRRISSTKNRLKQTDEIVFVKMKCLTGNVRVHAVKKSEIDNIRSDNIVSILDKNSENSSQSTISTPCSIKSFSSSTPTSSTSSTTIIENELKFPSIFNPTKTSAFIPISSSTSSTPTVEISHPDSLQPKLVNSEIPLIKPIPIVPFLDYSPIFFPTFQIFPKIPFTIF